MAGDTDEIPFDFDLSEDPQSDLTRPPSEESEPTVPVDDSIPEAIPEPEPEVQSQPEQQIEPITVEATIEIAEPATEITVTANAAPTEAEVAAAPAPAEPEPEHVEVPAEPAKLPVALDHLRIAHIIQVQSPDEFIQMFADFEDQIERTIIPLLALLNKVIMSSEVTQIEQHAAHVDAWRSRITRFASLAAAFVEHGKSSRLMMPKGKGVTDFDREAWKRTLTAAYVGLSRRLEGLIDDIDSRVNLCKKNGDREKAGFRNTGGRFSG
jgi:hypothetical protein